MKRARLNINHGWSERDIVIRQDGVVDEKVVRAFTRGHCHSFALALNARTGWELVGLSDEWGDVQHVLCQHPSGTLVDIEGPNAEDRWSDLEDHWLGLEATEDLPRATNGGYRKPRIDAAEPFVDTVLRKVEDAGLRTYGLV